jgi:hypothetical protein
MGKSITENGVCTQLSPLMPWPLGFNLNLFHLGLSLSWVISPCVPFDLLVAKFLIFLMLTQKQKY